MTASDAMLEFPAAMAPLAALPVSVEPAAARPVFNSALPVFDSARMPATLAAAGFKGGPDGSGSQQPSSSAEGGSSRLSSSSGVGDAEDAGLFLVGGGSGYGSGDRFSPAEWEGRGGGGSQPPSSDGRPSDASYTALGPTRGDAALRTATTLPAINEDTPLASAAAAEGEAAGGKLGVAGSPPPRLTRSNRLKLPRAIDIKVGAGWRLLGGYSGGAWASECCKPATGQRSGKLGGRAFDLLFSSHRRAFLWPVAPSPPKLTAMPPRPCLPSPPPQLLPFPTIPFQVASGWFNTINEEGDAKVSCRAAPTEGLQKGTRGGSMIGCRRSAITGRERSAMASSGSVV